MSIFFPNPKSTEIILFLKKIKNGPKYNVYDIYLGIYVEIYIEIKKKCSMYYLKNYKSPNRFNI